MQFITISGRIGKDAETRTVRDNQVTSFNVAVDQGYGDKKETNWFRVSAWGKKGAGAAPYLLKGGVVTVIGELEFGEYEGVVQYNIRATDFTLPQKQGDRQSPRDDGLSHQNRDGFGGRGGGGSRPAYGNDLDDEVPFLTAEPCDNARKRVI